MKYIFEGGRLDLIFYHYYASICKVKYCKIWPKCIVVKRNILFTDTDTDTDTTLLCNKIYIIYNTYNI